MARNILPRSVVTVIGVDSATPPACQIWIHKVAM